MNAFSFNKIQICVSFFSAYTFYFHWKKKKNTTEWKRLSGFLPLMGSKISHMHTLCTCIYMYIVYRIYYYSHFSWANASINGKVKNANEFKEKEEAETKWLWNGIKSHASTKQKFRKIRTQSVGKCMRMMMQPTPTRLLHTQQEEQYHWPFKALISRI